MGLFDKLFSKRDPWEAVPASYGEAIRSQLSADDFQHLTALLSKHAQFTPGWFPVEHSNQVARQLRERTAANLVLLAFRFAEVGRQTEAIAKGLSARENPTQVGLREALRLSVALVPDANPAQLMLPGYLLDAGEASAAIDAAKRAVPSWERRLSDAVPSLRGSFESDPLAHVRHEFLTQAGGDLSILEGLRDIAERRHAISTLRTQLSPEEFETLKATLMGFLASRGVPQQTLSAQVETWPLRGAEHTELALWILENMGTLRQHLEVLNLLRVAHVLQPELTNVNDVLADLYHLTAEGGGDEAGEFRKKARFHAELAAKSMRETLADPADHAEMGITIEALQARLERMQEILAPTPG